MNRTTGLLLAGATIAFAWYMIAREETAETDPSDSVPEGSTPSPAATVRESAELSASRNGVTANDDETEVVMGLRVLRDRNCTVQRHYIISEDGSQVEAYSCIRDVNSDEDPYQNYSNETLEELAYSDWLAAETLGKRLAEQKPTRAFQLMVRASALSGKGEPLLWLSAANYSGVSRNGVPDLEAIKNAYVLQSVARELGSEHALPDHPAYLLRQANVDERQLQELEQSIEIILGRIKAIQIEVSGDADAGGAA